MQITAENVHIHLSPGANIPLRMAGATGHRLSDEVGSYPARQPPALGEQWLGEGGIYVAAIPAMLGMPARHLVASAEEVTRKWGPDKEIAGCASHVDGPANTRVIGALRGEYPAANWCVDYRADGHADFFLPSRFDLLMAYLQAPQAFKKEGWYWSSTQHSRYDAFAQGFEYGGSGWNLKGTEFRVRAFRTIHFNA